MKTNLNYKQEILVLTSYPPRECGIATFSKDLIDAMNQDIKEVFNVRVCALENGMRGWKYPKEVKYVLNTNHRDEYGFLANKINKNNNIKAVMIQHEFGLFGGEYGEYLLDFLYALEKPIVLTFHTVLPDPDQKRKAIVQRIAQISSSLIVMTNNSLEILKNEYDITGHKITVIPHGIHPVEKKNIIELKKKYGFENRKIVSTFGLISSNKNIESGLAALPEVIKDHPDILYLIIGKTHPEVLKHEGEQYRISLMQMVENLNIQDNVKFINRYTSTPELLDLLQMSDCYLFISKDKNQSVSGTFAYALSCGCPVIATSIPHAKENLSERTGILIDFENPEQISKALTTILNNEELRLNMSEAALLFSKDSEWENVAAKHSTLLQKQVAQNSLIYDLPVVSLKHIEAMTHNYGIIQFSKFDEPDLTSGYTLDDNARALIALCMNFEKTGHTQSFLLIDKYLRFLSLCQKSNGDFFNYMNESGEELEKNSVENLEDSNGRAILALGMLTSYQDILPARFIIRANLILKIAIPKINNFTSPRAIAFAIKGLYYYNLSHQQKSVKELIYSLGKILVEKYYNSRSEKWRWFEDYLTYGNSILSEALLYAHLSSRNGHFKAIAKETFDFLISNTFSKNQIRVISNNGWFMKDSTRNYEGGEQPIDVSYSIQTLQLFHVVFKEKHYKEKMEIAFSWFLGNNQLGQMIYNPITGGCHDGLEKYNVNLNQGAESTICYLIARQCIENSRTKKNPLRIHPIYSKKNFDWTNQGRLTIIQ